MEERDFISIRNETCWMVVSLFQDCPESASPKRVQALLDVFYAFLSQDLVTCTKEDNIITIQR